MHFASDSCKDSDLLNEFSVLLAFHINLPDSVNSVFVGNVEF